MNSDRLPHRQIFQAIRGAFLALLLSACGAPAAVLPSSPMTAAPSGTALIFYAQPQVSDDLWPLLFQTLRADLAAGAGELPDGLMLDKYPTILRGSDELRGVSFSRIITIKLLGRCDVLPRSDRSSQTGPLGWVTMVSGKIQPFVSIDCTRVAQVLHPAIARLSRQRRQCAMAQAISHVLIHEWSHIASQSSAHSVRGLTQANLTAEELISSPDGSHLSASRR